MVRFQSGKRYQSAQFVLDALNDLNGGWRRQFIKLLPVLVILGVVSIGLMFFVLTKLQRDRAENFYNLGFELTEKGDYQEAIAAYDEATGIHPYLTEAWVNKGYVYGKLNIFTKQFHSCQQATNIDPNSSEAWLCLGNAQYASKQYQDSIQYFDKAINLACTPNAAVNVCAYAWYNKGESLQFLQQPADALKAFDLAIKNKQDYYFAWTKKGEVLLLLNKSQKALDAFEEALGINPKYEPAIEGKKKALQRL